MILRGHLRRGLSGEATSPAAMWRVLVEWWRPVGTAMILCLALLVLGPSDSLDRRMSDRVLIAQRQAVDPALLIVSIQPSDVRRFGGPTLSRDGMTALLNRLADAGVERVLIDLFMADALFADSDARLEAAMARFGPQRLALVSGASPDERPYARFARHATVVDARLTPDDDGWHRRLGRDQGPRGTNPATWLATGTADRARVDFDLRIDQQHYVRRSVGEVVDAAGRLEGRLVVISPSVTLAPSRAALPMMLRGDRATVLALAAQSAREGYGERRLGGMQASVALLLLGIALGFGCAMAARSGKAFVMLAAATCVILLSASVALGRIYAMEIYPARLIGCFVVMANVTLVQRLRIVPMMSSFLRGDITPEEVWAWRGWEASDHPALLLGADGRIKRSNQAAAGLVARYGEGLVPLCSPRLGERAAFASLADADGTDRYYQLDWPFAHIQIAVLRDNTESELAQRALEAQLLTDELTGKSNRRGFDYALDRSSQGDERYGVFFIDMNGFKGVNDTHGHDAGDELLVITAERLAALLGPQDVVARLGGDEFAILAPGLADDARAGELARRMAGEIARPVWLGCANASVEVGAAVGWAVCREPGEDPAQLLRRADKAMYREKLRSKLKAAA